MAQGKRYDKGYRLGATRLVVEQGYTQAEAARRLDVAATTIKTWTQQFRKSGELPPADQSVPEAEELKTLRKQLRRVQMENEIFKNGSSGKCVLRVERERTCLSPLKLCFVKRLQKGGIPACPRVYCTLRSASEATTIRGHGLNEAG